MRPAIRVYTERSRRVKHRKLGRTGLEVSEIGLGTEFLNGQPRDTVVAVIAEALRAGVSYMDLLFCFQDYLDNLGAALQTAGGKPTIAGHLGCAETDGQYRKSRDPEECDRNFNDMLGRVGIDRVDVLMIQNVDAEDDYQQIVGPGGLLELARRHREAGRARFFGISTHKVPIAQAALRSGLFDVLMFPVNPAFDAMPGDVSPWEASAVGAAAGSARRELYRTCAGEGVGLVAMKPFAGGWFFRPDNPSGITLTPVQGLSYALSQPGISTVVPGVKNTDELRAAMRFLEATPEEKDFSAAIAGSAGTVQGSCVYCNHCLPCPSLIDVGETLRLLDIAEHHNTDNVRAAYAALSVKASACVECGECVDRCPFGVDVIQRMRRAADVFGS